MRITVVGRGNVGGGLANLWEGAGHDVTRLGRDGGDVSDADVVLLAVPGDAVAAALDCVKGIEGKTVIDATNRYGGAVPPDGFFGTKEVARRWPSAICSRDILFFSSSRNCAASAMPFAAARLYH